MKKSLLITSLVAVMATSLVPVVVHPPAAEAATSETLKVNFSSPTGAFRGGASGTLYGFGDEGAPTQALVNGARITNSSQRAPFGTQHPSGDSLKIEDGFFDKHGDELDIYVQDYYPDWPYNGGRRPGDTRTYNQADGTHTETANGIWDYLEVVEFVAEAVATQSDHPNEYVFIPFNEPDGGNWYADYGFFQSTFLPDWNAAHAKIQQVYARHGLGKAVIGGPGDFKWQPQRTAAFLDHAKASNTLPDIFIWHELGIDNLATYRSHFNEYRAMERARGISPREINITEYGLLRDMGVPGQLVQWFSMFEDTKVDAQTAYWNYAGNLSDNSARPNAANGGWWMFKWYGDLAGSETVRVTPPRSDVADTLQGLAAVDRDDRRATVLYGGSEADQIALNLTGLDPAVFTTQVDVEIREAALTGAEGVAATPRVVAAFNDVDVTNGALNLTAPNYDRYAGYQVVVTPKQSRAVVSDTTWTSTVEAEDTALTNAGVFNQGATDRGGWNFLASGSKDVGGFNTPQSKADWTVTVPRAGTYRYQVIGATPGKPGRHALFVDGTKAATVQYNADLALNDTSKWRYRGSAEVTVNLSAGTHTLSLRASENGTTVLPNSDITLDRFTLTDLAPADRTVYPASTLRYADGAGTPHADTRAGLGQIQGAGRADAYLHAWESGYYDVAVDYRTTAASTVALDVDSRRAATLRADRAGTWTSTVRVHLAQGINELEISSPEGMLLENVTTTRARAGDSAATKIEAESAARRGTAKVNQYPAASGSNASGAAGVGFLGNGAANTLAVPRQAGFSRPGSYNVVVNYANAELSGRHDYNPQVVDRRLQVTEAGQGLAGSAYFRYTYAWDSFWERTIPVSLTTTTGELTFGNEGAFAPDIDYVVIAPLTTGTPTTTQR